MTKDEARELLGMEPCKTGGDCFKITISDMFIGSNDDPAEVTTDLMQESTDEVEVTDDEDTGGMLFMSDRCEHEEKSRTQNIGNLLAAAQKAQRAKFEVATMKFFKQQQKRLSGSLSGTEKADWSVWDVLMPYITENHVEDSAAWSALGEQEQKNLVEQFIGGLVNWPSEETAMEEIFKPLWKQTYDEGTRIAKQAYNIRGVDRPELLSQAKLHGGQRVRHVTQTTKENISRIVANGIEAGIGREKMADEILQEYEIQTRSRARLIADQETVMTLETGHYDMMQKSGATTKTWHHRPQKNLVMVPMAVRTMSRWTRDRADQCPVLQRPAVSLRPGGTCTRNHQMQVLCHLQQIKEGVRVVFTREDAARAAQNIGIDFKRKHSSWKTC